MKLHIIGPAELRANPTLVDELRTGTPDGAIERRFAAPGVELRAAAEGSDALYRAGGLGIVYNSRSVNLGGFVEVVRPGAVRDVLARDPDIRALFNHDPNLILGRTVAGTMRVAEQGEEGAAYEFDAPDTSYARDLGVSLRRGDVTGSSFAFRVARDGVEWSEDEDTGLPLRIIHRFAALSDMSPVTYPAYPTSTSGRRSERGAQEDTIGLLGRMVEMAGTYIDTEPDSEDVASMEDVLASLKTLLAKDASDSRAAADAAPTGDDAEARSRRAAYIRRRLAVRKRGLSL